MPNRDLMKYINDNIIPLYMELFPWAKGKILLNSNPSDLNDLIQFRGGFDESVGKYALTIYFLLRSLFYDNSQLIIECYNLDDMKKQLEEFHDFVKEEIPSIYEKVFPIKSGFLHIISKNKRIEIKDLRKDYAFIKKFFGCEINVRQVLSKSKKSFIFYIYSNSGCLFQVPEILIN